MRVIFQTTNQQLSSVQNLRDPGLEDPCYPEPWVSQVVSRGLSEHLVPLVSSNMAGKSHVKGSFNWNMIQKWRIFQPAMFDETGGYL